MRLVVLVTDLSVADQLPPDGVLLTVTLLLVRALLRTCSVLRPLAIALVLLALVSQPVSAQTRSFPYRDDAVRMLQQLIATGDPVDNEHDEGQWLQIAVNYATHLRDREIERLAIRAAYPLRVRVTRPVSNIALPSAIEILSYKVLDLRPAVPYSASIEASLDDGPYVDLGSQVSGSNRGVRLEELGPRALRPGTHYVRLRARLVFGDPQEPIQSEMRELPPIAYALYDDSRSEAADARRFIYSPATLTAFDVDPLLPSQPVLQWLGRVLGPDDEVADARMWTARYCSELTEEHHGAHQGGGLCSVIYFGGRGWIGQMWFRTGEVEISDVGASWYPMERPSLEALFLSDGRATSRLSSLPALLQQPVEEHPGDRSLSVPEIVVTPASAKRGAPAKVTVTVHNNGEITVQNLLLEVVAADGLIGATMRHFVVDIPAFGSQSVSIEGSFQTGYGLVFALPFIKGHGLAHDVVIGAPLHGTCAIRLVNPASAPRDYLEKAAGHKPDCVRSQ